MRAGKSLTQPEAAIVTEIFMLAPPYVEAVEGQAGDPTGCTVIAVTPRSVSPGAASYSLLEYASSTTADSNGDLPYGAAQPSTGQCPRNTFSKRAAAESGLERGQQSVTDISLRIANRGPRPSNYSVVTGETTSIATIQITDPAFLKLIEESNRAVKRRWLLYRCWSSVMDRESTGLETSFVELLHQAGARIIGTARVDLFTNLVARKNLFMDAMLKLFEQGLDNVDSVYLLHQIGARHVAYGLTRQDYEAYMGPFVRTVVACAHPSTMDGVVRHLLREFWQSATRMMMEGAVEQQGSQSMKHAPKSSPFALLFTDIEGSTGLWEDQPAMMETAVDQHHRLMRDLIQEHNGYEVKTIGDSFMIAFKSLADAVTFALRTQLEFLRAPVEGLVVDGTTTEASGPGNLWNNAALRVRIGLNWCTDATPKFDNVYKRYDFYGNDVNTCARVQDAACGGQILVSESTLQAINALGPELEIQSSTFGGMTSLSGVMAAGGSKTRAQASLRDVLGSSLHMEGADLKGLSEPVTLHSIFPKVLAGRIYGRRKKNVFAQQGGDDEDPLGYCPSTPMLGTSGQSHSFR